MLGVNARKFYIFCNLYTERAACFGVRHDDTSRIDRAIGRRVQCTVHAIGRDSTRSNILFYSTWRDTVMPNTNILDGCCSTHKGWTFCASNGESTVDSIPKYFPVSASRSYSANRSLLAAIKSPPFSVHDACTTGRVRNSFACMAGIWWVLPGPFPAQA